MGGSQRDISGGLGAGVYVNSFVWGGYLSKQS